uniref:NADH-ubiquinone oxidoreductase chain 6 n=1 Tax=Disteniazteca fimbriata TaxID=1216934 RepID=U3L063_9CUCU|nr:NADH dehydrogenase subunit 6 [Disteniazteca fimbriata]
MFSYILFYSIIFSSIFMFMNHPLSFGMILLMQTIMVAIITGYLYLNFWFSYIIFLIMIGGMLVLFMYMTSIASNEKFKMSYSLYFYIIFTISMFTMISMVNETVLNLNFKVEEMTQSIFMMKNNFTLIKYFNFPHNLIYILMIIYLFITLIMVVKITNIKYGPLRQKF